MKKKETKECMDFVIGPVLPKEDPVENKENLRLESIRKAQEYCTEQLLKGKVL